MFSHIYVVKNKQRAASFGVRAGPRVKYPAVRGTVSGLTKSKAVTPLADSVIRQIQRQAYEAAPGVSHEPARPGQGVVGKGAG